VGVKGRHPLLDGEIDQVRLLTSALCCIMEQSRGVDASSLGRRREIDEN
jgi:hypothetical protein